MSDNPLRLRKIHHVEMWVGDAKQAAYYYRHAFGFSQLAYAGLETGWRDASAYVLGQGQARLVLKSPLRPGTEIGEHVVRHGDGVKDIAFHVADADAAFDAAVARGAEIAAEPHDLHDRHGTVRRATIKTYGETVHSFISTRDYRGPFLPGYEANEIPVHDAGLLRFDHIVGNVELGKMEEWARWYHEVLGFKRILHFDDQQISTEYSALMSVVMSDGSYSIKFPINEPASGRNKSQIEEFLEHYGGPGVQHLALLTRDVVKTVGRLKMQGVDFLTVPDAYYEELPRRVGRLDEKLSSLRRLGILADRDHEGYLLQIFTQPVVSRPTLFFEIIQRKGSRGFGEGNFKALFEALEREQARRGNLVRA
ncbi:MAG: 4-hydroxyphenylpyruvate dioxygenase [Acidobacteria bacterium]|nr:MAG: 4-hydroxyphenylpyruvate dioxygenase [Acidobacteriota bacterium]